MNCKPPSARWFAVNRAAMLSRLPGVQLPAGAKCFAAGRPKLEPHGLSETNDPFVEGVVVPRTRVAFPARERFRY
jgi:hypothetical protein